MAVRLAKMHRQVERALRVLTVPEKATHLWISGVAGLASILITLLDALDLPVLKRIKAESNVLHAIVQGSHLLAALIVVLVLARFGLSRFKTKPVTFFFERQNDPERFARNIIGKLRESNFRIIDNEDNLDLVLDLEHESQGIEPAVRAERKELYAELLKEGGLFAILYENTAAVGCTCVLPLKEGAARRLLAGEQSSYELTGSDISKGETHFVFVHSVYLRARWRSTHMSDLLAALCSQLMHIGRTGTVQMVFAEVVTDIAVELVDNCGLWPQRVLSKDGKKIYRLDFDRLDELGDRARYVVKFLSALTGSKDTM